MIDQQVERRNFQAEVYLALATIIQAITVTALGNELVISIKNPQYPDLYWGFATGVLSLIICITVWFLFIRDYFYGYRLVIMTAKNHLVFASAIFILGFFQFIAFQFLTQPRLWLTLVIAGVLVVFLNSIYMSRAVTFIPKESAKQVVELEMGSNLFLIMILIASIGLILWYIIPSIDTLLFRLITLGAVGIGFIALVIGAVNTFQKHLDTDL
jgi:hypothetical protein